MTRFVIVILLIAVFFLSGVMYGGFKSEGNAEVIHETAHETAHETDPLTDRTEIEEELTLDDRPALIQKVAGIFERLTSYTFELITSLLYFIAKTFF